MAKKRKNKVRTSFRKQQNTRVRRGDLTKSFADDAEALETEKQGERVSGKGSLTRKRTIIGANAVDESSGFEVELDINSASCRKGRVLSVHGLNSFVSASDGKTYQCTVRGILKSLSTDLQHVVVAGDYVTIQLFEGSEDDQAVIVRVEPRRNQISRTSRKRQQIIVSNIDLAFVVASAYEPTLKPNLVDRFLVSAEKAGIQPVILINKVDLIDTADLQPVVGVWSQLGYAVVLTSTITGQGIAQLRQLTAGRDSVVTGQSGVGKSSILNAIEPGLQLKVSKVSSENQKGRHTTTSARLIPLNENRIATSESVINESDDQELPPQSTTKQTDAVKQDPGFATDLYRKGHLIDTPGIRQFQLWDVIAEEVGGYFRDIRPFINDCKFPDCSHTHEEDCSVKWAVADGKIDARRYESYCQIRAGDEV
jgi:ribosome biogenesis GTPase